MKPPNIQSFVEAVETFCEIVNLPDPPTAKNLHYTVRNSFIRIIYNILALEKAPHISEPSASEIGADRFKAFIRNIKNLEFTDYLTVVDALNIEEEDPCSIGCLFNDLVDIYSELQGGLDLHRDGHTEAAHYHWLNLYYNSWGDRIITATKAIEQNRKRNLEAN